MDKRSLLSGMAIGAALALAFDPARGNGRRALIREKVIRGTRRTAEAVDATIRDMGNRARGIAAATRSRFQDEEVDDVKVIERVRARIGRASSHPHAIHVYAHDGEVTLTGPVLADEVRGLLMAAASVRGVHSVVNELEPHESAVGIRSLQGEGRFARPRLLRSKWAPGTRALVSAAAVAAGGFAIAYTRR